MVNGAEEIGVRGSICARVFIVGAGAPGGVRLPWALAGCGSRLLSRSTAAIGPSDFSFIKSLLAD